MGANNRRNGRRSTTARDTASEAAVDITELDTTILNDGRGRVTVTTRVFNTGFDAVDYDGQATLSSGGTLFETINIRGSAGAGADADEQTLRLETDGEPPTEALLTVALSNGDQEQRTVQFVADDPGFGGGGEIEAVDCSTSRAYNDGLNVEFSVDGPGGESFTATIRVNGQEVSSRSWTLAGVPPTTYEQIVDPSDLPVGEDMPVEIGVSGNFSDCGAVTVEGDDPAPEPPQDLNLSVSGCSIESENPLTVAFDLFSFGESGSTPISIAVDGSVVHTETADYNPNGGYNEITVPSSSLPTGTDMPVEIRL